MILVSVKVQAMEERIGFSIMIVLYAMNWEDVNLDIHGALNQVHGCQDVFNLCATSYVVPVFLSTLLYPHHTVTMSHQLLMTS